MAVSTSACMCVHSAVYPISVCVRLSVWLHCIYAHAHIWLYVCVSLCVHKATLDGHWGRRWPSRCVFVLAAVQHSTFLCDIQYCDLRKPALQRSALSLSARLSFFLSLATSSFLSLGFSLSLPFSLSFTPPFFHIWTWEIICQPPPPHTPSTLSLFSRSLKVSPQHFPPIFSDRGPLMRHLSQRSKTEHTSFCCHWEFITLLSWSLNVSLRCIFLLY